MEIKDIETTIRNMIRVNEKIVSAFDSNNLCSDYDNTVKEIKELIKEKKELNKTLIKLMNEFFAIKYKFKFNSFKLVFQPLNSCFKFNLPKMLDKTSRQYFCYISTMNRLEREYDVISTDGKDYYIFDITFHLNLDKLVN